MLEFWFVACEYEATTEVGLVTWLRLRLRLGLRKLVGCKGRLN